jgi:hypothetical protein
MWHIVIKQTGQYRAAASSEFNSSEIFHRLRRARSARPRDAGRHAASIAPIEAA